MRKVGADEDKGGKLAAAHAAIASSQVGWIFSIIDTKSPCHEQGSSYSSWPYGTGRMGVAADPGFRCASPWAILLIRQEKNGIVSHPFPQKTREWMGHPHSI
jgi:hypothetical protein